MMAKVSGSYEKFNKGVSQQVPEHRLSGQHTEQVNFISDFIVGLIRRRGSILQDEKAFSLRSSANEQPTILDTESFKSFDFSSGGKQYTLFYRTKGKVAGSAAPFAWCFNKETAKIIPCNFANDTLTNQLVNGGASAIVNMGDYVYIAGNNITTTYSQEYPWNDNSNRRFGAVWVKTGNYSKTYEVELTVRNTTTLAETTIIGQYETKPAAYPGILDTSDILSSDPDYQKKINDANNAYNTAVNQWIGEAAKDVLPSNIAQMLKEDLEANIVGTTIDGVVEFTLSNSTIGIETDSGYVITIIKTTDKGDETAIDGVGNQVSNEADLIAEHFPNKVVKVLSKKSNEEDAVYYKAVPKYDDYVNGELTEVVWKETAGVITKIENTFIYSTIVDGEMYFAGSPSSLETIAGITGVPGFEPSQVGDNLSMKVPYFVGKKINYLGSFQDRLIIGSGSTLLFSKNQRYLDFFRSETRTLLDNDPIEIFSLGSEDDVIVSSATFDRDLIFFGKQKQYVVSGKQILTPKTTSISPLSAHEDAIDSKPVSSGNFIFYTKQRNNIGSLHQLQTGLVQDSPESYECSVQLSDYITSTPIEILAITTPNNIVMRTDKRRHELFVYTYFDSANGAERLTDSWSRWEWNPKLGYHVGLSYKKGDLFVATIRHGLDQDGLHQWFLAVDKFVFDSTLTPLPILDSMRKLTDAVSETEQPKFLHDSYVDSEDSLSVSYDNTSERFLLGDKWKNRDDLIDQYPEEEEKLWVGWECPAMIIPTNPYIKDPQDQSIINGRLTINKYTLSVANTGGMEIDLKTDYSPTKTVAEFTGKSVSLVELGKQQLYTGPFSAVIGKETKEFEYIIKSRGWQPCTIKSVEWVGQMFYNSRRV